MGDERTRSGASGDGLHHRGLHLQIAPPQQKIPHRLDDARALDEYETRLLVDDQIDVTLAVLQLLVGQAVELLRQGAQRFREQPQVPHPHRDLVGPGLEQHAVDPDDVADIVVLERFVLLLAGIAVGKVKLDLSAHVLDGRETRLAHDALQHDPACDLDGHGMEIERVAVDRLVFFNEFGCKVLAPEVVGIGDALLPQRLQLRAALFYDRVGVVHQHPALIEFPASGWRR